MLKRTLGASLAVVATAFAVTLQKPLRAEGVTQIDIPVPASTVVNACTGEIIAVDADSLHVVSRTDVRNGIEHVVFHLNANLSRVGSSGANYNMLVNEHVTENFKVAGGTFDFTNAVSMRLVGQGPSNNPSFTFFFHTTINANGDVTSFNADPPTTTCSNG